MKERLDAIGRVGSKIVSWAATILAVILAVYSGFVLYDTIYTGRVAFLSSDLAKFRPGVEEDEPTFEEMMQINPDTCAWVTMLGTHIDYPVVQGENDVEYSNKDIYGENSLTGTIYLTTINNNDFTDSFNLLYGHHMDNGAMFGDIQKYEDYMYFYTHQNGILITTRGVYDIRIFGRLSADAYDSRVYMAGDRPASDFPEYLYYLKSLSVQWDPTTDIEGITENIQKYIIARDQNIAENGKFVFSKMPKDAVENGMQLIAFSTCADATTNGRQLLVGTMKFRTEPLPPELLGEDEEEPLVPWGHGEAEHWALLNLICMVMMVLLALPGTALKKKYLTVTARFRSKRAENGRSSLGDFGDVKIVAWLGQMVLAAFGVLWFIWTEDPLKPMVIVDRWTLGMIGLFAAVWTIDVFVIKNYKRIGRELLRDMKGDD